jgi:hypothetical protein
MAKGRKTGGKPFPPGKSGNPNGRPALPPDVRDAQKLTNDEYMRISTNFMAMTRTEIQEALQRPDATMLELMVGGIVAKAAKDHDYLRATFLLDRVIGKVKEQIETTHKYSHLSVTELESMTESALEFLRAHKAKLLEDPKTSSGESF